jgi:8-oxo-dGTP diphosphatase
MRKHPSPIATVDVALFTLKDGQLSVLLAPRPADSEVFPLADALPGGYIHADKDDDAQASAQRVLTSKAGVSVPHLEQLYTFSGKFRDPRGWSLSIAYYAVIPFCDLPDSGLTLVAVDALPALPFDHGAIVGAAVGRLRSKASYSSLPLFLLPKKFTMDMVHAVYQQVMGVQLNKASFRRKIEAQGIITPLEGEKQHGAHRPAQLYRATDSCLREFDQVL